MMTEELNNHQGVAAQEAAANAENSAIHPNGDGVVTINEDGDVLDSAESVEGAVGTPAETIARLEAELSAAQAQAAEAVDRMQRTAAEFQNTRKRQERMLQDSLERATQRVLVSLLPVLDDFNLAFQNLPDSLTAEEMAWIDGFRRIHGKLASVLTDEGVTAIPSDGPFDPNQHEAVTNEPSDEVESGHIIATLRPGYVMKDRVLRPALVRVAQ